MSVEPSRDPPPAASDPGRESGVVDSATLLGAGGELAIRHNGKVYRLRRTRLGKLILTA